MDKEVVFFGKRRHSRSELRYKLAGVQPRPVLYRDTALRTHLTHTHLRRRKSYWSPIKGCSLVFHRVTLLICGKIHRNRGNCKPHKSPRCTSSLSSKYFRDCFQIFQWRIRRQPWALIRNGVFRFRFYHRLTKYP